MWHRRSYSLYKILLVSLELQLCRSCISKCASKQKQPTTKHCHQSCLATFCLIWTQLPWSAWRRFLPTRECGKNCWGTPQQTTWNPCKFSKLSLLNLHGFHSKTLNQHPVYMAQWEQRAMTWFTHSYFEVSHELPQSSSSGLAACIVHYQTHLKDCRELNSISAYWCVHVQTVCIHVLMTLDKLKMLTEVGKF